MYGRVRVGNGNDFVRELENNLVDVSSQAQRRELPISERDFNQFLFSPAAIKFVYDPLLLFFYYSRRPRLLVGKFGFISKIAKSSDFLKFFSTYFINKL